MHNASIQRIIRFPTTIQLSANTSRVFPLYISFRRPVLSLDSHVRNPVRCLSLSERKCLDWAVKTGSQLFRFMAKVFSLNSTRKRWKNGRNGLLSWHGCVTFRILTGTQSLVQMSPEIFARNSFWFILLPTWSSTSSALNVAMAVPLFGKEFTVKKQKMSMVCTVSLFTQLLVILKVPSAAWFARVRRII